MRFINRLIQAVFVCLIFVPGASYAAYSPVAVSIVTPVQFPPSDYNISGLRLSALWGAHRDVYGLDFGGVGNITNQRFVGSSLSGLFNYTKGRTSIIGFQLAGLTNYNIEQTQVYGVQASLAANYNKAASNIYGFQIALANLATHTNVNGVQVGLYNRAKEVRGLQVGVVNVANNLYGLQIGLLNFHYTGLFYVAPIINFGY